MLDMKANLIMGHMIPGNTGYECHKRVNRYIETQTTDQLEIDFKPKRFSVRSNNAKPIPVDYGDELSAHRTRSEQADFSYPSARLK